MLSRPLCISLTQSCLRIESLAADSFLVDTCKLVSKLYVTSQPGRNLQPKCLSHYHALHVAVATNSLHQNVSDALTGTPLLYYYGRGYWVTTRASQALATLSDEREALLRQQQEQTKRENRALKQQQEQLRRENDSLRRCLQTVHQQHGGAALQLVQVLTCCAVLCCAVLCRAVMCCAVLCCAVLCCAVLCWAGLCCAVLCCAVLCRAVLLCAVPCCAMLCRLVPCCAASTCAEHRVRL